MKKIPCFLQRVSEANLAVVSTCSRKRPPKAPQSLRHGQETRIKIPSFLKTSPKMFPQRNGTATAKLKSEETMHWTPRLDNVWVSSHKTDSFHKKRAKKINLLGEREVYTQTLVIFRPRTRTRTPSNAYMVVFIAHHTITIFDTCRLQSLSHAYSITGFNEVHYIFATEL